MAKTNCPITRQQFADGAKPLTIKVYEGDELVKEFEAKPRTFSTQSLGYNVNDKMELDISGKDCTLQVGMNLTLVGSKELPA